MMLPSTPPVRVPWGSGQGHGGRDMPGSLQRSGPGISGWSSRCWQRAVKHLKSLHQMFSCTSLPRSARGAWFNCGYLWPEASGWLFTRSQGFYFLLLFSIPGIYGPWVWQNSPEKLWTQSTSAWPRSLEALKVQARGPCAGDAAGGGWSGSLSSCFWHRKHQPQSSQHKNWGQSCCFLFVCLFVFLYSSIMWPLIFFS